MPLVVHCAAASSGQPVTVGLPFPKGVLRDPRTLALRDADGAAVPLQAETLARWSDGSVQWLLVDFIIGSTPPGLSRWTLQRDVDGYGESAGQPLLIDEDAEGIVVDTGAAIFLLNRSSLPPFMQVMVGGCALLDPRSVRTVLADGRGRLGLPRVCRVAVEARGPVRATVRWDGVFTGRVPCRFIARLCFFRGTGLVRLRLTVHNPNRAKHPGGLWDLGDPGSMLFRELSLELGLQSEAPPRITWSAEVGQPVRSTTAGRLEVYQDSSGGENWQSRNHVNRDGRVPCSFRGYRVNADTDQRGLRASPTVALEGANGCLTVAIPEFWQQFPKAIAVDDRCVRLSFFPPQWGDLHELQGGEQKTHTAWLCFSRGGKPPVADLAWVHRPARVHADPEWYAASGAIPHLAPTRRARGVSPPRPTSARTLGPLSGERVRLPPSRHARLDGLLAEVVDGPKSFFARREVIDEYGWRHYGEVYADHEGEHYAGPAPVISHYNNQYDQVRGFLMQFCRTGNPRWFDLADALARHVIDIDIYHTDRDRAAYNGGLFWFTDHYRDAATCTHRTYSRANARPGDRSYGGGPSSNHNFTTGLLMYYYLTGDPLARAAVLSLADWVVTMDDGRRTILGLIDDGPTGLASCTGTLDYQGPGRGAGNSVTALLDAWLLTGRRAYLAKAEQLIRRVVHPADDVAARDLLNVEKRWSYTVFLTVLARYLDLKAGAGEIDRMYAYARASLLHYAEWMAEHEVPYFDHADRLEYPTEAWAGQEFRKANVLRLAAAHADEPLRGRLLKRGAELSERAWADLLRFASRTTARAVALVMVEGTVDEYLRHSALPAAPRPARDEAFDPPEPFVPQKLRVLSRLRTGRGLAWALGRLVTWPLRRWFRRPAPCSL